MAEAVDFRGKRRERHAGWFALAESAYPSRQALPLHAHEHPFFALLLSGSFTEELERGRRRCAPSSLAFYPAGIPHADAFGPAGGRAFLVEARSEDLDAAGWGRASDEAHLGEVSDGRLGHLALRLYAAFLRRDDLGDLAAEELALEMFAELRRTVLVAEPMAPLWLHRVRERIHAEFRGRVRVADLARDAGVHPVYLARVFRRHLGCSVVQYLQRLRTRHAFAALVAGDEPISELALALGYTDQAHFTRRFGGSVGLPPGRLRALAGS